MYFVHSVRPCTYFSEHKVHFKILHFSQKSKVRLMMRCAKFIDLVVLSHLELILCCKLCCLFTC